MTNELKNGDFSQDRRLIMNEDSYTKEVTRKRHPERDKKLFTATLLVSGIYIVLRVWTLVLR